MNKSLRSSHFTACSFSSPLTAVAFIDALTRVAPRVAHGTSGGPIEVVAVGPLVGRRVSPALYLSEGALNLSILMGLSIPKPSCTVAPAEIPAPWVPVLLL
jgi:hypothetical protein